MIQEYALEPDFVATCYDPALSGFFINEFGYGVGRVVSLYPKNWRRLVWKAFDESYQTEARPLEKKRLEELMAQLKNAEIRRSGRVWADDQEWLTNAESENARHAFHTIIARANPRGAEGVCCGKDIVSGNAEVWERPATKVVDRDPDSMASCVAVMLRWARKVTFVDPHFGAEKSRYLKTLAKFLRLVGTGGQSVVVEYHVGGTSDGAATWDWFQRRCEERLPEVVPTGLTLTVCRLKVREPGQKLHNRYILTDIGGVLFGTGLDGADPPDTDDVILLGKDSYHRRFNDYVGPDRAFDVENTLQIAGKATR